MFQENEGKRGVADVQKSVSFKREVGEVKHCTYSTTGTSSMAEGASTSAQNGGEKNVTPDRGNTDAGKEHRG